MLAKTAENPAEKHIEGDLITTGRVALALAVLFGLNLLLRVFYLRNDFVNGDEGVRALTALRMLQGARLYVDVVTDKPPGTTFFYAAVFATFGRSMKAVHLAAILWNYLTALVVYRIGSHLFPRKCGLWAAFIFAYFSTNYLTQDTMAANTELLMTLPYATAFYLFVFSLDEPWQNGRDRHALLFASGLMTGLAVAFKQVAIFNLIFFVVWETLVLWRMAGQDRLNRVAIRGAVGRLVAIATGFLAIALAVYGWLVATGAAREFWRNTIVLNVLYTESEPLASWLWFLLRRSTSYVLFNAALLAAASVAVSDILRKSRKGIYQWCVVEEIGVRAGNRAHLALVLWLAFTIATVPLSGRFYGHYFIPALPALALLSARGLERLVSTWWNEAAKRRRLGAALAILFVVFAFGVVRFHGRTAVLAYETLSGRRLRFSQRWGMTKRQEEAEVVSRFVRARLREGEPLYIWGYAHDVFWQTGCRPASRYLTPYFLDGRFPDAEATPADPDADFWRQARANLLDDLRNTRPRLILEVYGGLRDLSYPEIVDYIRRNYREAGRAGPDPSRPFRVLELVETSSEREG